MSNYQCHKLITKKLRKLTKEERAVCHEVAHAYIRGGGFDNWTLIQADKLLLKHGIDARAFNKNPRNWLDQPD